MGQENTVIKKLAALPLIVRESDNSVFRAIRGLQERAQREARNPMPRKLTPAELNHLHTLLEEARESGSYYGPREQYYARTERLIQWCQQQGDDNA